MSDIQNEPAYSKSVIEFLTVAHQFCLTLEAPEKHEKQRFLDIISKILPLLYLKGSLLPKIPEPDKEANERFLTLEEYEILFNKIRDVFGKEDVQYLIDINGDKDFPVKVSASELLADIYQDMKDFVLLYQKNSRASKQNAAYHARLNFLQHWGIKAVNAIKILHYILYGDYANKDE